MDQKIVRKLEKQIEKSDVPCPSLQQHLGVLVGVDDWVLRKGQQYGTILCDLQRGTAIDLYGLLNVLWQRRCQVIKKDLTCVIHLASFIHQKKNWPPPRQTVALKNKH